jgi:hypothetical protein
VRKDFDDRAGRRELCQVGGMFVEHAETTGGGGAAYRLSVVRSVNPIQCISKV